jgi:hypothetical protein
MVTSVDPAMHQMRYPDSPNRNSVEDGNRFQDFIMRMTLQHLGIPIQVYTSAYNQLGQGETIQRGWEFKFDSRCSDTRHLSIEVAEKAKADNPNWVPSGIYRCSEDTIYVQGNYEVLYYLWARELIAWHQVKVIGKINYVEFPKDRPTIRRFFLPFAEANRIAWHVLLMPREGQPRLFK